MFQALQGSKLYQKTSEYTRAQAADPHGLITMLFDGAIERIVAAKGAMQRNEVAVKGMLISKAITVISGLRAHLDMEKGGELSKNLSELYQYMEEKLFEANFENNEETLNEIVQLIQTLRDGWVQIKDSR